MSNLFFINYLQKTICVTECQYLPKEVSRETWFDTYTRQKVAIMLKVLTQAGWLYCLRCEKSVSIKTVRKLDHPAPEMK